MNIFPGTNLTDICNVIGTLSWFVINVSYVIGEKLAKPRKTPNYADKGAPQFFYEIVQYWVTYDLVKIIAKYGLKPDFNDNLKSWSKDIYNVVYYLQANNADDNDGKRGKLCLDILYDTAKTVHWTNFGRCGLGTRRHLANLCNFALPLVVIKWQRMLVEHFSENTNETFFEKGNYEPQKSSNQTYPLNNLHLKGGVTKHADMDSQVFSFDEFTIKEKLSLGYWADKILQQEAYFGMTNGSNTESQAKKTADIETYSIMDKNIKWEKDKDDDDEEVVEKESSDMIEDKIVLHESKRTEQLKTIAEAMNVGRTLLAKINRKTKEQKNDKNTVNLGCNLLQKYIARELDNDDIFLNWDKFMDWIREQKDNETIVLDGERSKSINDEQSEKESTEDKSNTGESLVESDYSSSSDEEERDDFLTDGNGNRITVGHNTGDKDGDKVAGPTTEVSTHETSNNGEKNDNEQTDGVDEKQDSTDDTNTSDKGEDDHEDGDEDDQEQQNKKKKIGRERKKGGKNCQIGEIIR